MNYKICFTRWSLEGLVYLLVTMSGTFVSLLSYGLCITKNTSLHFLVWQLYISYLHWCVAKKYVSVLVPAMQVLSSWVYWLGYRKKVSAPCGALIRPNTVKSFTLCLSLGTVIWLSVFLIQPVTSYHPFVLQARTLLFGAGTSKTFSTIPLRKVTAVLKRKGKGSLKIARFARLYLIYFYLYPLIL